MAGNDSRQYTQSTGNPFYNPTMQTADWGQGIRSILNSMWGYKEQRRKEEEEQRQWELEQFRKQQETTSNVEEGRARAGLYSAQAKALLEKVQTIPSTRESIKEFARGAGMPESLVNAVDGMSDTDAQGFMGNLFKKVTEAPPKPERPSAFMEQKSVLDKMLKERRIDEPQYNEAMFGLKQTIPEGPSKTATIRQANRTEVHTFYSDLEKNPDWKLVKNAVGIDIKTLKKLGGTLDQPPTSPQGYRLDVPRAYNSIKLDMNDGAATSGDQNYVMATDRMFRLFKDRVISDYGDFNTFMRATDDFATKFKERKDFDKNLLKFWFDLYVGK